MNPYTTVNDVIGHLVDLSSEDIANHKRPSHGQDTIDKWDDTPHGKDVHGFGHQFKIEPDNLSHSITSSNRHFNPYVPRSLTVREMARLSTFPDDIVISGGMKDGNRQIGNAVPPALAESLAQVIMR